ncbi:MAG: XdhC family protein [Parvularculaceae bacterium]
MIFDPTEGDVIAFALSELRAQRQVALTTLVGIDGSSPRALGAQMAVSADGRSVGSISSGCLERAIVKEAQAAIKSGKDNLIRYGKKSRFLDIVLPCGSGVDILFSVNLDKAMLEAAANRLKARKPSKIELPIPGADKKKFRKTFEPPIRIVAAGYGPELTVLAELANAAGFKFCALSPDAATLKACNTDEKMRLVTATQSLDLTIDARTACVLLFHDREWERSLAPSFLRSSAFFVGAVGGGKTAVLRREMLIDEGLDEELIERLSAPIGLIPMTRDPSSLAISIIAEIAARASRT